MTQGKYSKEFKLQAVKRVLEDGKSQKQVATELGMSIDTLRLWVRTYKENKDEPFVGSGSSPAVVPSVRAISRQMDFSAQFRNY